MSEFEKTAMTDEQESRLRARLDQIATLEKELAEKEASLKAKETAKKSVLLRLPPSLHNQIAAWAEEDFRSINGQIEFLLTECVKKRRLKNFGEK